MDEVQSWWEVPTVAHFCYVFRAAFNLFYIGIGELEAAILNVQDPDMCISLEQLVTRLLQGCFDEDDVTIYNWEEKLHELFSENCEEGENPLENTVFSALSPRTKVEVLLKLCEFRLDADGALEAIKDIPSEDMQARCVGKDGQNNLYWYFCDERLYKEDLSIPVSKTKKQLQPVKGKTANSTVVKNGKRTRERKSKTEDTNKPWSIVCHNSSDWEVLVKSFSKSRHKLEKELVKEIKDKYVPMLTEVVTEKDRLLRKRFLELAPKRVSSRLSKVQAQKKLEEQMAAEAAERERQEMEEEQAKREANKKEREIEERKKRAEAREKIVQGRLQRAQHREMMRGMDDSDSNSNETCTRTSRSRRASTIKQTSNDSSESEEEEEEEDEEKEAWDSNIASHSEESEIEQSAEEHSSKSESEDSGSEESDNCASIRKKPPNLSVRNSISHRKIEQNTFTRPSVIQNSYGLTKWNAEVDSQGHKIHILRCSYDGLPSNKRMKTDESNYKIERVNPISTNEMKPSYYNASRTYHPFRQRNLNSCTKVTSSPPIIRIDFIKPPPKPEVSR